MFIAAALCCSGCARAQKAVPTQPDGHWWLAANADERGGFQVGFDECTAFDLARQVPRVKATTWVAAITGYYRDHPSSLGLPVGAVAFRVQTGWRRTGAYRFVRADPQNEYDGEVWRVLDTGREGIVMGFTACRASELHERFTVPAAVVVKRVNTLYGVDVNDPGSIDAAKSKQKLGAVILRAEKEKLKP